MGKQKYQVGDLVVVSECWSHHLKEGTIAVIDSVRCGGFDENYIVKTLEGMEQAVDGGLLKEWEGEI